MSHALAVFGEEALLEDLIRVFPFAASGVALNADGSSDAPLRMRDHGRKGVSFLLA